MLAAALLISASAGCAALAPPLTPRIRHSEAARISSLAHQRVRPSDISYRLVEGNWRLIFATPAEAERGVFVLRRTGARDRLVDIWGGILSPDERGQAAAWARSLPGGGVPPRIARCMDDAIGAGH
jgi:hypothetical protein